MLVLATLALLAPQASLERPREAAPTVRRVLFVGHDPEAPDIAIPSLATDRTRELYAERTAAWAALLREHFDEVEVVFAADYSVPMSEAADVTVFDATPSVLSGRSSRGYALADLDFPAVTIAEQSDRIGARRGSKLDWL